MTSSTLLAIISLVTGFFSSKIWEFFSQFTSSKEKIEIKKLQLEAAHKHYREEVFKEYEQKFESILEELAEAKQELADANQKIAKMMGYFDSMTKIAIMHLGEDKPEVASLFKEFSKKINFAE